MNNQGWPGIRCEIPNSDAHRVFRTLDEVRLFLAEHGLGDDDFEQTVDGIGKPLIKVPAFAESRRRFCEIKAKEISRWGAE